MRRNNMSIIQKGSSSTLEDLLMIHIVTERLLFQLIRNPATDKPSVFAFPRRRSGGGGGKRREE